MRRISTPVQDIYGRGDHYSFLSQRETLLGRNVKATSNGKEGSSKLRVSWFKVCNFIAICP